MTPIRKRLTVVAASAAVLMLSISGCTATPSPDDASPKPDAAPAAQTAESTEAEDEMTCAAFGDVLTIVHNAQVAFTEDRMTEKEQNAWFSLASRVLGNIPAADEGDVADALAAVKEAVPAAQDVSPSNIGSQDWAEPGSELYDACAAAGFEVATLGFAGG